VRGPRDDPDSSGSRPTVPRRTARGDRERKPSTPVDYRSALNAHQRPAWACTGLSARPVVCSVPACRPPTNRKRLGTHPAANWRRPVLTLTRIGAGGILGLGGGARWLAHAATLRDRPRRLTRGGLSQQRADPDPRGRGDRAHRPRHPMTAQTLAEQDPWAGQANASGSAGAVRRTRWPDRRAPIRIQRRAGSRASLRPLARDSRRGPLP
jgi:hypothetical protein